MMSGQGHSWLGDRVADGAVEGVGGIAYKTATTVTRKTL